MLRPSILALCCALGALSLSCSRNTPLEASAETDTATGDESPGSTADPTTAPSDSTEGVDGDSATESDGDAGDTSGTTTQADDTGTGDDVGTDDSTGNVDTGEPAPCQVTACQGKVYECGDCLDNDGDGLVDTADPDCWGPCDNNEAGWKGEIPGQNQAPCKMDCYFDGNSGSGNDDCYWSHACDPLEPSPEKCTYNPNANIPGTQMDCSQASAMQSQQCDDFCGPLVPNGCDCFGCCEVKVGNAVHVVYLGTEDSKGDGTCNLENVADPDLCAPCTIVPGCFNPCRDDQCEVCIGQVELPEGCEEAKCPNEFTPCDPALGSADCPTNTACITGCCTPVPQ